MKRIDIPLGPGSPTTCDLREKAAPRLGNSCTKVPRRCCASKPGGHGAKHEAGWEPCECNREEPLTISSPPLPTGGRPRLLNKSTLRVPLVNDVHELIESVGLSQPPNYFIPPRVHIQDLVVRKDLLCIWIRRDEPRPGCFKFPSTQAAKHTVASGHRGLVHG